MQRDEMTQARAAVAALWRRAEREVAFELARWALQLGRER
jgi:hypothetical protein